MHDMNQAIAVLEVMHHWTIKTVNRNGERVYHECTIWDGGKRVTAYARTPLIAVKNALAKLARAKAGKWSGLKVIGVEAKR